MPYERVIDLAITHEVLVRLSHSGRPIERYSVVLLLLTEGTWQTVRVYDNHLGSHHMHRYTFNGGKQGPEAFHAGAIGEAIPAAIEHLRSHWQTIIGSWTN